MSKLQELVEYIEKQYTAPNQHGVVARIIDKARSLLKEEQSQLKYTTQAAVESWKAIAEQSHTEQGLVEEIEEWRSVWIPELPGFNPYANTELEQILSRHTAKVDKDKEVEPKEDKK